MQEAQAATVSGAASAVGEGLPPPEGLWGVELDGELVAVISDLMLGENWRASFNAEEETHGEFDLRADGGGPTSWSMR